MKRVERHIVKKAVPSLLVFCSPIFFPVLVNQAEFCFEDIETGQRTSIKERF